VTSQSCDSGYEKSAHLYDLFDQKANIEFFFRYACQARDILDVGAGTGRIALPLAERGVQVCCVEASPAMRQEFERKLVQRPDLSGKVQLVAGKANSFKLDRRFPVAFLSGVFDHFLDDAERLSSLVNIGRHLDANGLLVFDVFLGLMQDTPLAPAGQVKRGAREYRRFVGGKLLPGGKKETRLVFKVYQDGELVEQFEERSLVGTTSQQEIHRVLSQAGFVVKNEWSSYDLQPYGQGDALLIIETVNRRHKK
jgi:SAM-dependent methyltransferase